MRRFLLVTSACTLVALLAAHVALDAQKRGGPNAPPPSWYVSLPSAEQTLPPGFSTDSVPFDVGTFEHPVLYSDGAAYASGAPGIAISVTGDKQSDRSIYTVVTLAVSGASGRRVGVQGLEYGSGPGTLGPCRFSGGSSAGPTLAQTAVVPFIGCIADFFGSRALWSATGGGHLHPPAPYDRFEMRVRIPIDIATLADGARWEGWALCTSTDLWFADYHAPGVCDASAPWNSAGGGFIKRSGWFQVARSGNAWTIVGYRDQQRLNEWQSVATPVAHPSKTTPPCQVSIPNYEVTTPIRFWLTLGY